MIDIDMETQTKLIVGLIHSNKVSSFSIYMMVQGNLIYWAGQSEGVRVRDLR